MSKNEEKWVMSNCFKDGGKEILSRLKQETKLPESILIILYNRGLRTVEEINKVFNFKDEDIPDINLMKDATKCADYIMDAINKKLEITIFGDYDAGATRF